MTEQEFNLLEIATVFPAKLRARPAQIVCPKVLDSNLLRRLFDDRPNRRVAQLVAVTLHSNPGMIDVCFQRISGHSLQNDCI
jgi:hypothetical protein